MSLVQHTLTPDMLAAMMANLPAAFWAMQPIGVPLAVVPALLQDTIPANFVPMDGRTISDPASPLNTLVIPNWNNDVYLMGSSSADGSVSGSNTFSLAANQLPIANLALTIASASAGTPAGTVSNAVAGGHDHGGNTGTVAAVNATTSSDGAHSHTYDKAGRTPINASILALGTPVTEVLTQTSTATSTAVAHTHTVTVPAHSHTIASVADHTHTATFAGAAMATHTHTGSVALNGGSQSTINKQPKTATVKYYIRFK